MSEQTMTVEQVRKDQIKAVLDALRSAGITQIDVQFDGCGDSGQINDILVEPEGKVLPVTQQTWTRIHSSYGNMDAATSEWTCKYEYVLETGAFHDAVEQIVYDLLESKHHGWEINEGSFGTFVFDVKENKLKVEFNERVETYNTEEYTVE